MDHIQQANKDAQEVVDKFIEAMQEKMKIDVLRVDLNQTLADKGYTAAKYLRSDFENAAFW